MHTSEAGADRVWDGTILVANESTADCARSPYGESTFKRNRPSFAVLMVLGGGGGERQVEREPGVGWGR